MKKLYEVRTHQPNRATDVSNALRSRVERSYYGEGNLERLDTKLGNAVSILADMVELLHKKSVITDDEVEALLGGDFKFESEDEQ